MKELPRILHIKENLPGLGPDIRKCTRCGTRLWLPSDGTYTTSLAEYLDPPAPFVNCEDVDPENMIVRAGYLRGLATRTESEDREMLLRASRSLMCAGAVLSGDKS